MLTENENSSRSCIRTESDYSQQGMSTMTETPRTEQSEVRSLVEREALRLRLIGGCRDAEVSLRVQAARTLALALR